MNPPVDRLAFAAERERALARAIAEHQAGALHAAEAHYRALIAADERDSDPFHLLGVLLDERGQSEQALPLLERSIALDGTQAAYHDNLGLCLARLDRLDEAVAAHRKAVATDPRYAEAHNNLGVALERLGQLADAEQAFARATTVDPGFVDAQVNLGVLLGRRGCNDEARAVLERAVQAAPEQAAPHNSLGVVLRQQGELALAAAQFLEAVQRDPKLVAARSNLGAALRELGRLEDAVKVLRTALALAPEDPVVLNNLGNALARQGLHDDALASYRHALAVLPAYAETLCNQGISLLGCGLVAEARQAFEQALDLEPEYFGAVRGLKWSMLYEPDFDPEAELARRRALATRFALPADERLAPRTPPAPPHDKLRVGYLSSDFREHPIARNTAPLITHADRRTMEVFCYADVRAVDDVTRLLASQAHAWTDVSGMTDRQVAETIRADEIDVLLILAAHFDNNRPRVAEYRPAPVQVSFHDAATSASDAFDYLLVDDHVLPASATERFTETLVRLPCFYCFVPRDNAPAPRVRPTSPGASRAICLGSFNNPAKVTDASLGWFAAVLTALPESRLVLKYRESYRCRAVQDRILEALDRAARIDPARVEFRGGGDSWQEHQTSYDEIDVALDTFPFSGSSTTFDALYMGVPVVSRRGPRFVSNMSAGILGPIGLGELVCDSLETYVATACRLAGDRALRDELRRNLRQRIARSPLLDYRGYAHAVERTLRSLAPPSLDR